jgi:tetratricopeptide (TPR) repeat protein
MSRQTRSRIPTAAPHRNESAVAAFLRRHAVELGVFVVALLLRLSFVSRLRSSVLAGVLHADEEIYWNWSTHLLTAGPVGPHPFFMGPLYPYSLAAVRSWWGLHDPGPVLYGQAVIGAAACALLAAACRARASRGAAALAGLFAAGYGMAILHDGLVLTESLLFALHAAIVYLASRPDAARPRRAGALGAAIGLATQGRSVSAVALAALALGPLRRSRRAIAVACVAFLGVCLPAALHNFAVSGAIVPTTYNLGFNAYVGNHPEATGSFVPILEAFEAAGDSPRDFQGGANADGTTALAHRAGRPIGRAESSAILLGMALEFVREHPGDALRLAIRKLFMVWNFREYHQIESMAVFTTVLGFVGFTGFAPLALLAVPAMLRRRTLSDPFLRGLALTLAGSTLALLPFFVTDRYRLHFVPYLVPFAAIAADAVIRAVRAHAVRVPVATALACAATAALVFWPLPSRTAEEEAWSVASDLGRRWLVHGDPERALAFFREAVALEASGRMRSLGSVAARSTRAALYEDAGTATLMTGDTTAALALLERAHALMPAAPSLRRKLAAMHLLDGNVARAAALAPTAGDRRDLARVMIADAGTLDASGDGVGARRHLEAAVAIDGGAEIAWTALIRLAIREARLDDAERLLAAASRQGYPATLGRVHEAWLLLRRGDRRAAERLLASLPPDEQLDPPARATLEMARGTAP